MILKLQSQKTGLVIFVDFLIIDEEMMPDPDSKKPEGYDDIPKTIVDPDAVKPEDWYLKLLTY